MAIQEITLPRLPQSAYGKALTNYREALGISALDAARLLDLSLLDAQGLERGVTVMQDSDWCALFCRLSFEWRKRLERGSVTP